MRGRGAAALALLATASVLTMLTGCSREREAGDIALAPAARDAAFRAAFADEQLIDQRGAPVRLYDDVAAGHVVVVDFVFTDCTTICSPMTATMARARRLLEEQGVSEVRFVSISLDPARDTPARLAEFAGRFGIGDAFWLLTGEAARVERVVRKLGGPGGAREGHAPFFLVGSADHGGFTRLHGLVSPTVIAEEARRQLARTMARPSGPEPQR